MSSISGGGGGRVRIGATGWIVAATLLGLGLRCVGVATAPLTYDEGATLYFARLPWGDLVGAPARLEPNPPLFYALVHLAVSVFGEREWVLRLPSVVAGVMCIPVAARLAGERHAVAAAVLVATSAVGVLASQDARAYAMLTLALLCAAAALVRLVEAPGTGRGGAGLWAGFVVASVAALYLHNTAPLLLAALNLAVLNRAVLPAWRVLRPGFAARWVLANLVVLAAWLPWLPVVLEQAPGGASNGWMSRPDLVGLRYAVQWIYGQAWLREGQPWVDAAFLGVGGLGVVLAARRRVMFGVGIALLVGVPVASWAISQWRPIMNGKTLLPLAPVFLVFVGIACSRLGRPGMVAAGALVAVQVWSCRVALTERGDEAVPAIVARLRDQGEDGDRVYLARPELEILLDYYGWPRDRLVVSGPAARVGWYRHGTVAVGAPLAGSRLWVLTRSDPALHRAIAAGLEPVMTHSVDDRVGRGRSRTLELSLFVP